MAVRILESVKNESKLREFSKIDKIGYQGAEPLPSGKGPLIASGETADVVVAGSYDGDDEIFVQIILVDDESYGDLEYYKIEQTEESAISMGEKIAKYLDSKKETLLMAAKKLGFKRI